MQQLLYVRYSGKWVVIFALLIGCSACATHQSGVPFGEDTKDVFKEFIEDSQNRFSGVNYNCPYTGFEWGGSFDYVIGELYKNRVNVIGQDKEEGLITFIYPGGTIMLQFDKNRLYHSIQVSRKIDLSIYHEVYYDQHDIIKSLFGFSEKGQTEDGALFSSWETGKTQVTLYMQIDEQIILTSVMNYESLK